MTLFARLLVRSRQDRLYGPQIAMLPSCRTNEVQRRRAGPHGGTAWRVGYLIAPADLVAKMAGMQEFLTSHAPSMAQVAAITALREGESYVAESVHRYRRLRRVALNQLGGIPGATVARPDGSIYVFFRLPGSDDSLAFCRDLLAQSRVVLAPGRAFGRGGESWFRLCIANEEAVLCQAIDRIGAFLTQQGHKS